MPVEALSIRFIFGEEGLGGILAMEPELAGFRMLEGEGADFAGSVDLFYDRLGLALIPGPGIAVPNCRQKMRSEEHTSELQSRLHLVCRLLLEKKKTQSSVDKCACRPDRICS